MSTLAEIAFILGMAVPALAVAGGVVYAAFQLIGVKH